jgi:secreted trypsin-like serine protease
MGCDFVRAVAERESAIQALIGLGCAIAGIGLLVAPQTGRSEVGHPVAGVAALIDASAPADDIFNGQFCGGTLVAPDRMLTAAHCVVGKHANRIEVVVGADNLCRGRPIDGDRVGVLAITTHPRYDAESAEFDLAMLTLERRFPQDPHAIGSASSVERDDRAVALGWGQASLGGVPACRLTRVDVDVLAAVQCAASIGAMGGRAFDARSMICAASVVGDVDTCVGDSGGAILIGSSVDESLLIGITSWGYGCGAGMPGVYADPGVWPESASGRSAGPMTAEP